MNDKKSKMTDNKMGNIPGMPRAINVNVRYDSELQKITGNGTQQMMISEGASFLYLLMNVFSAYPEIEEKYPPGTLGMTINGIPPRDHAVLLDGDTIDFSTDA